jgi:hypothetical protein
MRDNMPIGFLTHGEGARCQGLSLSVRIRRNAGHVDRAVKQQTLPEALGFIWQDYRSSRDEKLILKSMGHVVR